MSGGTVLAAAASKGSGSTPDRARDSKAGTQAAPRRPGARTFARLAAVQALYQMEQNGNRPDQVIAEFERHRLAAPAGPAG